MKKNFVLWLFSLLFIGTIFVSCDEDDPPPDPDPDTVTDSDGNVYPVIEIGAQTWMAENLKTTSYSDGTDIEFPGPDDLAWQNNTTGAYAWYNNDEGYKNSYGGVYNWYAINNPSGLCPTGWRVPSQGDWTQLVNFLITEYNLTNDLEDVGAVGNKLKSCRQIDSPLGGECNTSAHPRWHNHDTQHGTDDFGFGGLPGGGRTNMGEYANAGIYGYWWTATEGEDDTAVYRNLNFDQSIIFNGTTPKVVGISVRCIKD